MLELKTVLVGFILMRGCSRQIMNIGMTCAPGHASCYFIEFYTKEVTQTEHSLYATGMVPALEGVHDDAGHF
jgi:hypothetical protein